MESDTEKRYIEPVNPKRILNALVSNFQKGKNIDVDNLLDILNKEESVPHGIEDLSPTLYKLAEKDKIKIIEKSLSKILGLIYPTVIQY